eukprot:1671305-Pyramimonas_sp.AAC.1
MQAEPPRRRLLDDFAAGSQQKGHRQLIQCYWQLRRRCMIAGVHETRLNPRDPVARATIKRVMDCQFELKFVMDIRRHAVFEVA